MSEEEKDINDNRVFIGLTQPSTFEDLKKTYSDPVIFHRKSRNDVIEIITEKLEV